MPGLVTRKFRQHNAEQFYEAFTEAALTRMYLFVSRVTAWADDNDPPAPVDSIQHTEFDFWREMIAAKKLQTSDISYAAPRYNWTSGKVYREYDIANASLFSEPASSNTFYVVSSSYNVYKCLFNNKGAASTVEPTGTSTSTLVTSDGYRWKFLYTIGSGEALKFLSTNWIPVKTLSADDGSAQWDVQQAASNGAIEVVDVFAGGSGYLTNTGTLVAVADGDTMTLAATANTTDNIYNGSGLYITSGLGAGQVREITDYNGATKVVQLATIFGTTPNTSSTYVVSPYITFTGDGTGATAYANVTSGAVNYINIISSGSNYSQANVVISANSSHGTGASANAYITPPGGHGSDPISELAAHNVVLNVQLSGSESSTFPTTNDFRTLGLVKDPLLDVGGTAANGASYDQTTQLAVTSVSGSGAFTLDETIRGGTSGATGKLVSFANTNAANTAGTIRVIDSKSNGSFTTTETLTGLTSGITATLGTITYGVLKPYFGDIVYVENRAPISRAADQIEDIKLVVKF